MAHDHNHDHEERELITLVDEQGNETLFEILLTIDGKKIWKELCPFDPCNAEEDENGEVEIQAYSFTENEAERRATFNQSQKTQMQNGDMIRRSLQQLYGGVKTSSGCFTSTLETRKSW